MTADIVVVGSINQDIVVRVSRAPGPGETVIATGQAVSLGGKGANQAVAAARSVAGARNTAAARSVAGARNTAAARSDADTTDTASARSHGVRFVGAVGDDAAGHAALANLAAAGVDTSKVRSCDQPTGAAYITVSSTGENSIVVVPGANAELTVADIDHVADLLRGAAVVVVQLEIALAVVERSARIGAAVILNAAPARPLPAGLLADVDVLIVNEGEAAALLGAAAPSEVGLLTESLRRLGPANVVVTPGGRGAAWRTADADGSVPATPVDVVDTTGAGDAFIGAFAAAYVIDPDLPACVAAGVRLATATTTVRGAQVPSGLITTR